VNEYGTTLMHCGYCVSAGRRDHKLSHRWSSDVATEGHADSRRFRVSGIHYAVRWHWHAGSIHFTWGLWTLLALALKSQF